MDESSKKVNMGCAQYMVELMGMANDKTKAAIMETLVTQHGVECNNPGGLAYMFDLFLEEVQRMIRMLSAEIDSVSRPEA